MKNFGAISFDHEFDPKSRSSLIYNTPPGGVQSGQIESLYSLLQRAAYSHSLSAEKLVRVVLVRDSWFHNVMSGVVAVGNEDQAFAQPAAVGSRWDWAWQRENGRRLIGSGSMAGRWALALAGAMGVASLTGCTLTGLSSVVSSTNLIRRERLVCLECLTEDSRQGHLPFERLLWRLGSVNCCPIHRTKLVEARCGNPNEKRPGYLRVQHPGVCGDCGSIAFTCIPVLSHDCTAEELWRAQNCSSLLEEMQNNWNPMPSGFRAQVSSLMKLLGGIRTFSERIGAPKSIVSRFLNEPNVKISLDQLLDIAWVAGCSVSALLQGRMERVKVPESPRYPVRMRRPRRIVDHAELARSMELGLSTGLTIGEIANKNGVDRATLRKHGALYAALRTNAATAKAERLELRYRGIVTDALVLASRLASEGKVLSLRNARAASCSNLMPNQLSAKCFRYIAGVLQNVDPQSLPRLSEGLRHIADAALRGERASEVSPTSSAQ